MGAATRGSDRTSSDEQLARLEKAIADVLGDLSFEPIAEAELPKGFPTYTPVGAIEVKQYPEYRMAAGPGFWTLFTHIQLNRIAMTAPVQMTYESDAAGGVKETGMAFLYGDKGTGSAGRRGNITVLDNQPQVVVSIGVRGPRSPAVLGDARGRLQSWLNAKAQYRSAGAMRVMGYNSPSVPTDKQYFEVQIPIEKAADS